MGANGARRIGGRVDWTASSVVERFVLCFGACYGLLLAHLDVWSEPYSDVHPPSQYSHPNTPQYMLIMRVLQLEFIYNAVQLVFAWTQLANFYLAFFFLVSSATKDSTNDPFGFMATGAGKTVFEVILKLYIALLFVVLVCSLGNRPQVSRVPRDIRRES